MAADIPADVERVFGVDDRIDQGGAAMTAYAKVQFTQCSAAEVKGVREALLKYCELDTLAMVMLWEEWQDQIKSGPGPSQIIKQSVPKKPLKQLNNNRFEGLQYKFKKNAMSYCTNVWDIDFYQLRVAVLNHLQQNLRILKKYKNNTRIFLDNTYEMNVSLPKVNKTILGRIYAEITLESSLVYLGAHNHNNTNKLPY